MKFKQLLNNCLIINQWLGSKRLFKQNCLLCQSPDGGDLGLCLSCQNQLPWHNKPHCPQCGLLSFNSQLCGHCLKSPPSFDITKALFTYNFPLDSLLQRYKYGSLLSLGKSFATLMTRNMLLNDDQNNALNKALNKQTDLNLLCKNSAIDLIMPMPMHPKRLQVRGFNQALEISKIISKKLNIPLDYSTLVRNKFTPPQASLTLKERVKSIRGVFSVRELLNNQPQALSIKSLNLKSSNLKGLRIALIDDVMTTGASLNELAKTVKKAGASHVECWVLARTLPK